MKKIGEYTCKGKVDSRQPTRIQLFDGRFDTAFVIKKFETCNENPNLAQEWRALISTQATAAGAPPTFDWSDNTQLAWSWGGGSGTSATFSMIGVTDPENLVVQDIWIIADESATDQVNYMIQMEKYDISDARGALAMVANYSQGSDAYPAEPE